MLYIIPTPIGNLGDITLRAIETLKTCDYILCEDTRHSSILLSHYQISKPLKSFHKFSELSKESEIIKDLQSGLNIALISDAGTPGISDPGTKLIQKCIDENIHVTSLPGPCAAITALSCSGLNTDLFQFIGFLPRKSGELQKVIQKVLTFTGTTICYESPHRIKETLQKLNELAPDRRLVIARELTKKFEELIRGNASELLKKWNEVRFKGEIILLIEGENELKQDWEMLTPLEHVAFIEQNYGVTRQEAIKMVAELRGVSKRDVYNFIEKTKNN